MWTLIENVALLLGEDLQIVNNGWIKIDEGTLSSVSDSKPQISGDSTGLTLNGEDLLAIPGLINAHTHIADSIAKDLGIGLAFNELVHPIHGLKTRILNEAQEEELVQAMAETARDMLASGITTFADFRECGLRGVEVARRALRNQKQRAIILGRPSCHFREDEVVDDSKDLPGAAIDELVKTLDVCNGLGLSGPNEYTDRALQQISEITRSKGKLLAIHAAESIESKTFSLEHFSSTEIERTLRYMEPDFVVHATNSTPEERVAVSENRIPVVCCPRANSILGLGIPPILDLLERGVRVALGTDNVMLNAPDMFREMEYTSKVLRALHQDPDVISSKDILKMATVNAAEVIGLRSKIGSIEEGKRADITFLNLNSSNLCSSKDLLASVVHRARPDDVKCVMVDGEICYGSILKA